MRLLDTTLRDGGYKWEWKFSDIFISDLNNLCLENNVEFVEQGYYSMGINQKYTGSNDVYLLDFKNISKFDVNKFKRDEYLIRIAYNYVDSVSVWNFIIDNDISFGRIMLQPMRVSKVKDSEILTEIRRYNDTGIKAFYIVDSFGALDVEGLDRIYKLVSSISKTVPIGIHLHNNLTLANDFIKWAKEKDVIFDISLNGAGRGGGNMPAHKIFKERNEEDKLFRTLEMMIKNKTYFANIEYIIGLLTGMWNIHQKHIPEIIEEVENGDCIFTIKEKFGKNTK